MRQRTCLSLSARLLYFANLAACMLDLTCVTMLLLMPRRQPQGAVSHDAQLCIVHLLHSGEYRNIKVNGESRASK
eukprot:scaffold303144_cov31-Tisochrysis_lutea.AAC.1